MTLDEIERMTVVPADSSITINGDGCHPCVMPTTIFNPQPNCGDVHAIQWFNQRGHMEFTRGPSIPFTDKSLLQPFIQPWLDQKEAAKAARIADLESDLRHYQEMGQEALVAQVQARLNELRNG